jgi:hypothetical protein
MRTFMCTVGTYGSRMEDERDAHRLERRAGHLGPMLRGRRRQRGPAHMREADAAAFEQGALFHQARDAVALQLFLRRFAPRVPDETALSVLRFERFDDALLQLEQPGAHPRGGVGLRHGVVPPRDNRIGAARCGW